MHGYTGAIDIVEGECWRQIEHFSSNNSLSEETIRTLQKRGYLTTRTPEEELQYVWKIANVLHKAQAKMKNSGVSSSRMIVISDVRIALKIKYQRMDPSGLK